MMGEELKNLDFWSENAEFEPKELKNAIDDVLKIIDHNLIEFKGAFLSDSSKNNIYEKVDNTGWTPSFWTGMLCLAYEATGENKYLREVEEHLESYENRILQKIDVDTHDLGFVYTLSCVSLYKMTNNEKAKQAAIKAAQQLSTRYFDKAKIIQAWGDLTDERNRGRMIIDCLMNLPLLYWAAAETGESVFSQIAKNHAEQAGKYLVREDCSTYHTYFMDVESGLPKYGATVQGFSDTSCWSRGQAWGIYGFILSYIYTKDRKFLDYSQNLANYFLNRLPEDCVCYWDLIFTAGDEERDSSAASTAACGLLELSKYIDDGKDLYKNAGIKILKSLYKNYSTKKLPNSNGLLLHAVYAKTMNKGIDECCIWGDYFYFEGLVRLYKSWNLYW